MPNRVIANIGFDLGVTHAGVVIPTLVILTDMAEAEPVIGFDFFSGFRCPMLPLVTATRPVTATDIGILGSENFRSM